MSNYDRRLRKLESDVITDRAARLRANAKRQYRIPGEVDRIGGLLDSIEDPPPPGWQPDPMHVRILKAAVPEASDDLIVDTLWRGTVLKRRGQLCPPATQRHC